VLRLEAGASTRAEFPWSFALELRYAIEGGVLVMETPNPESVVAGSVNFHRDPTHLSPVHPDTLAFLCEMTGFSRVEIRRLSPTPPERMLPTGGGEGPVAERLDAVVGRLNDLLYGYQDYAVLAWR